MEYDLSVLCMSLHVHFRWGVALVGKFLYWALLTPSWVNIFSGTGGTFEGELI